MFQRVAVVTLLVGIGTLGALGEDGRGRPEVVAVDYPHWHSYDHGNAWKGEGWTEGCYLLPEERTGAARLEAIKRTFGVARPPVRRPAP